MNATVAIVQATGPETARTTAGLVVVVVVSEVVEDQGAVLTPLLAGGEAIPGHDLGIVVDAPGQGQETVADVPDPATATVAPAARATIASRLAESPTTAKTASPGTGNQGASPEAGPAQGLSQSLIPGPSLVADPQSSRTGQMGMGEMVSSRKRQRLVQPGVARVVLTEDINGCWRC